MSQRLQKYGVRLSGIYVCPHHPTAGTGQYLTVCNCRKGEPGMLLQAAQELTIDLQQSYMVGDKEADIQAGQAAGCRSILVQTGYGCSDTENAQRAGAKIVADLTEAAEQILAEQRF
ncbi:MAG: HAD-IIIA family hydrolase [Desulfuromonadales bacterium]|nr:HAD-IIIA family hydrolase [Desulfuromonadales bacterium]NOQ51364.1 HAD-IIIA family hydrolase [Desulfuromonadaceae bacterium]